MHTSAKFKGRAQKLECLHKTPNYGGFPAINIQGKYSEMIVMRMFYYHTGNILKIL